MQQLARFLVPVKDGKPRIPQSIKVIDAEIRGTYAEVLVDAQAASYLRDRDYAAELFTPRGYLSYSQINTYLRCPMQYFWRYEEGLKIPPASAVTVGVATHRAVECNYRQKIETKEDLQISEVQAIFAEEFDQLAEQTAWEDGESPGTAKDQGIEGISLYMREIAPAVQPAWVEAGHEIQLENERFKVVIDLIDILGRIRDLKTVSRTPPEAKVTKDLQLTTYAIAHREVLGCPETGLFMDCIVQNKNAKVVSFELPPRSEAEIKRALDLYNNVAKAIREKIYYRQPHNFMCTPSGCGYYQICMGEED